MDTPENELLVQVEDMENLGSSGDANAGIAPCRVTIPDPNGDEGVAASRRNMATENPMAKVRIPHNGYISRNDMISAFRASFSSMV